MRKFAVALLCLALPLLGACNTASTTAAVQTIEQVAQKVLGSGALPFACKIFAQAELYFNQKKPVNSVSNINLGTLAIAGAEGICANPNNPPTTVAAALTDLNAAWVALEAATTVPAAAPTPTPTSN